MIAQKIEFVEATEGPVPWSYRRGQAALCYSAIRSHVTEMRAVLDIDSVLQPLTGIGWYARMLSLHLPGAAQDLELRLMSRHGFHDALPAPRCLSYRPVCQPGRGDFAICVIPGSMFRY